MNRIRNRVRTLLRIRKQRQLPPAGPKPSVGSRIVANDFRMTVQAGMSDALWLWLLNRGWREVTYRPERRRYNDIGGAWVTRLYEARDEERGRVLLAAKQAACASEPDRLLPLPEESQEFA